MLHPDNYKKTKEILVVEQEFEVCGEEEMKGSPLTFNIFALWLHRNLVESCFSTLS